MIKKDYSEEYQIIKILQKTPISTIYLTNKYGLSFKNIIEKIDISNLSDKEVDEIEHEININNSLNSRFILKINDCFHNQKNLNFIYIISEFFQSITLKDFLLNEQKKLCLFIKEEIIWKILIQLCLAIYEIHSKNIIHRNLTLSQILLDSELNIKLTNFKNSYLLNFKYDLCNEELQINEYTAPEVILNKGYNTKSDIWSLGVILYELCSFDKPFIDEDREKLSKKIIKGKYKSLGNKYSKNLTSLIYNMLKVNYHERFSINDIIHEKIFNIKSKELSLSYYSDKIINSQKTRCPKVKNKFVIYRNDDKNIKNLYKRDEKQKNYLEELIYIKQNVEDILGKPKTDKLFTQLTTNNINEVIYKYNYDSFNPEDNEKLKLLLVEYIHLVSKGSFIKNKI